MKRRIWKILVSALLVTVLLVGALPVSAASVSTNFNDLANFINQNGEADENGYMTLGFYVTTEEGTIYYFLQNQGYGIEFKCVLLGTTSERMDMELSFILQKSYNVFQAKLYALYAYNNQYIDELERSLSINRTAFTTESEYTISGSTYITQEEASELFTAALQGLCLVWDSILHEELGFGLRGLGFTSYCFHIYDNDCDPDCNYCGETRAASHSYGDWTNTDATSHQQVCSVCGDTVTGEHEWGPPAPGSYGPTCQEDGCQWFYCTICNGSQTVILPLGDEYHSYGDWQKADEENHSHTCDICQEAETAPHNWDNGTLTQQPTDEIPGIITYTCADCGATKTREVDYIPGDVNGDGSVNSKDVEQLLWFTLFPNEYTIVGHADYDGNGTVNSKDVERLLWHTLFPSEYPL